MPQMDVAKWPARRTALTDIFRRRTRDEWCASMEGTDVCFAPVLSMAEAPAHPHNAARGTFVEAGGPARPRAAVFRDPDTPARDAAGRGRRGCAARRAGL